MMTFISVVLTEYERLACAIVFNSKQLLLYWCKIVSKDSWEKIEIFFFLIEVNDAIESN